MVIPLTGLALKCLVHVVTYAFKVSPSKALKVQIRRLRARAVSNPGEPRTVTEDWGRLGISPVSLGTCTVNFHLYIQVYRAYATSQGVLGRRINRTGKKSNKINYNKLHMQVIKGFFCWQVDESITGGGGVKKQTFRL